jgi:hypothetical protein
MSVHFHRKRNVTITVWEILCSFVFSYLQTSVGRSQWPRGLRRRSSAARLARLWIRIPPGVWMFVCCECCVLSGRGLCDGLITRPGVLPTVARCCVWSRNLENEETKARYRAVKIQPQWVVTPGKQTYNKQTSVESWSRSQAVRKCKRLA